MPLIKLALPLVIALAAISTAQGEVFRWVDEKGEVHYSDKPKSEKSAPVSVKSKPVNDAGSNYQKQLDWQQKTLDTYAKKREEKRRKKEELRKQQAQKSQECARLKDTLRNYNSGGRVYTLNDDGDRVYQTEQERATKTKELSATLNKRCR